MDHTLGVSAPCATLLGNVTLLRRNEEMPSQHLKKRFITQPLSMLVNSIPKTSRLKTAAHFSKPPRAFQQVAILTTHESRNATPAEFQANCVRPPTFSTSASFSPSTMIHGRWPLYRALRGGCSGDTVLV